jgi:hypothetical protein
MQDYNHLHERSLSRNAVIKILGCITAPKDKGNNHAIAFMMEITAIMPGKNPISWAKNNFAGAFAAVSTRAKLVNQAIIASID